MKRLFSLGAILVIFLILGQPAYAFPKVAARSAVLKDSFPKIEKLDLRVEKLEAFLDQYDSPLTPYAKNFIEAADDYQIDFRLLPAITGVESSFGKRIPLNSYNAYGWNNGQYWFQSWEESIDYLTRSLKEKYFDRGLDTPDKIGPVYAPPSPLWAYKVVSFMEQIEEFGKENSLIQLDLTL